MNITEKREKEKQTVQFMIALYCRKKHHTKKGELCVRSVRNCMHMHVNVLSIVHIWKQKRSVPNVRHIAMHLK